MLKLDFDIVKDLEDAGASQELAKAVVRAISDKTISQLATKSDLAELRTELAEIRANMATKDELAETRNELAETRETLRAEMAALELRLTEKMATMHTKVIMWLVGTAIASISLMAAIGQLLK